MKTKRACHFAPKSGHLNICGAHIRLTRKHHHPSISQTKLVECLERHGVRIDRTALSRIENHERAVCDYELKAIASCLATSVALLIDEQAHKQPTRKSSK